MRDSTAVADLLTSLYEELGYYEFMEYAAATGRLGFVSEFLHCKYTGCVVSLKSWYATASARPRYRQDGLSRTIRRARKLGIPDA